MRNIRYRPTVLAAVLAAVLAPAPAHALSARLVGSGFDQPLFVTAPQGDSRLFVVEKPGRIQVIDGGTRSTFLDIRTQVDSAGERGLLGLAFDPNFASNGQYYVNYIDATSFNTVVARYTAPLPGVTPATPQTLLTVTQPGWPVQSQGRPGSASGRGSRAISTCDG